MPLWPRVLFGLMCGAFVAFYVMALWPKRLETLRAPATALTALLSTGWASQLWWLAAIAGVVAYAFCTLIATAKPEPLMPLDENGRPIATPTPEPTGPNKAHAPPAPSNPPATIRPAQRQDTRSDDDDDDDDGNDFNGGGGSFGGGGASGSW